MNQWLDRPRGGFASLVPAILAIVMASAPAWAGEWTFWRGPFETGESDETGLVSSWSPEGENLAWRADFVGRSTPVAFDGRVCAIGRAGQKQTIEQLERVACFDAGDGDLVWEYAYPIYHTTVAFNRAGWASVAADPETGYVFAHGVAGRLNAFDAGGKVVWTHFLPETVGHASGYGGRTQTPLVDGDLLILSFVNAGWGDQAAPRHRTFAFDKRTGEIVWVATPGNFPKDMNTQGGPVVAEIGERRMLVSGNADGWIYALDIATGETVWKFHLSKRGINVTPVVRDGRVYISHSEENLDTPDMGRVIAIDATGSGDVTATHEVWRINELQAGFPSPVVHDGKLYVIDNSANLHRIDAATGKTEWSESVGTVGKGSAVWADGKLYVGEVNGRFHILKPGDDGAEALDTEELSVSEGRYAEIYGSPAVGYGRVFFATEDGLYALGDPGKKIEAEPGKRTKSDRKGKPGKGEVAAIHVVPQDVVIAPGDEVTFRVRAVNARGEVVKAPKATWSLDGLAGKVDSDTFRPDPEIPFQAGAIVADAGGSSARVRVRVIAGLPWSQDFESFEPDATPAWWIGAKGKFKVVELEGDKVLVQPPRARGLQRSRTFVGPSDWSDYTIQADVLGTRKKRRMPDIGIIAAGYTLDIQGVSQKLQIRSWPAEMRMAREMPFEWEMDTWYTMKMRVEVADGKATIRGKVWNKNAPEPESWMLIAEDPFPATAGSPGLIGYAPANVYYDNLKVWVNN